MRGRSRTGAGAGVAAAVIAATLALSGCSGDGGSQGRKAPTSSAPSTSRPTPSTTTTGAAPATASPAPTATPSDGSSQGVEGVWLATEGGTKVQLVLGKGTAGLTSTSLCGGSYTDKHGIALTLTCMDGNKERTSGHGTLAADGSTLTVEWAGGPTDTFSRTGLPSN